MKTSFLTNDGVSHVLSRNDILRAMRKYDSNLRRNDDDAGRLYAVRHDEKLYPPKQLLALSMGTEVNAFNGGESKRSANGVFRELGFEIICLDAVRIPQNAHDSKKINALVPSIARLERELFAQRWTNLHSNYGRIKDGQYPGVYLLAYSNAKIEGRKVTPEEVFYVGMSHAGIIKRLQQFMAGLRDGHHHSAAKRFFNEYAGRVPYEELRRRKTFYVAAVALPCAVNKTHRTPTDLKKMGEVARLEFYALASIKSAIRVEPPLNKK